MYWCRNIFAGAFCVVSAAIVTPARAEPVAIVEEVAGDKVSVGLMELLEPGAVIELADGGSITLGYLESCVRERISGGHVVIGEKQSTVTGGKVNRETIQCRPEAAETTGATGTGAALVFRGDNESKPAEAARLMFRVPVFLMEGVTDKTLRIERLDRREAIRRIQVSGPVFDAVGSLPPLTAGGRYRASIEDRAVEFIIDRYAAMTPGPALERLVRF